jgi:hypothetical protein
LIGIQTILSTLCRRKIRTDFQGILVARPNKGPAFVVNLLSSLTTTVANITDDKNFSLTPEQHVAYSIAALDSFATKSGRIALKAGKPVNTATLAKRRNISATRA